MALATCVLASALPRAGEFELTGVTDHVTIAHFRSINQHQIVISSDSGLIVLNSQWSETVARECRAQIAEALQRDDFIYNINVIDQLDYLGGNAAFADIGIIGHESIKTKYGDEDQIESEVEHLIDVWQWKSGLAREELEEAEDDPGKRERVRGWLNQCERIIDELQSNFSFVPPTISYDDRIALNLGSITLELIWFGKAGNYNGMTVIVIPEEKIAIVPSLILHSYHLAPYPFREYKDLDVPRWITVLEELLESDHAVEQVILDVIGEVHTNEWALPYLDYIRRLWNDVQSAKVEGMNLEEVQDRLSLDREYSFIKERPIYVDRGDDWTRNQHRDHVRLFYLQGVTRASEIIEASNDESVVESAVRIAERLQNGDDIYVDERKINGLGYAFISRHLLEQAIAVLRLNVIAYPKSANAYDSLAEAFMKAGDRENAIENYRISLELNPENANAAEKLRILEDG
ncbi:MAG: hypothetical protein JSU65_03180 [Candidatus Zixiibacteriota bacterium]|nr:MAG: hypothetical protein JSU65_03180 [candidate division Zixibacteria bacterium]